MTWLRTGVPRATFSKSARYEVGSAVTLFKVKAHAQEFLDFLDGGQPATPTVPPAPEVPADQAAASAEDEPDAERLVAHSDHRSVRGPRQPAGGPDLRRSIPGCRSAWTSAVNKPLFVGEMGIRPTDVSGTPDDPAAALAARASAFDAKLAAKFPAGSRTAGMGLERAGIDDGQLRRRSHRPHADRPRTLLNEEFGTRASSPLGSPNRRILPTPQAQLEPPFQKRICRRDRRSELYA